jgi:hypothetical protein
MRAGLVIVAVMVIGWEASGTNAVIAMGISALMVALITVSSSAPRFGLMAVASVVMAVSTFIGASAESHTYVLLALFLIWGCAAGLLTVLGSSGTSIGINAIVGLVAFGHIPLGISGAAAAGGFVLVGGLIQSSVARGTDWLVAERKRRGTSRSAPPVEPKGAGSATFIAVTKALRSMVSSHALPARHGIRLGIVLGCGWLIAHGVGLSYGYWAPLSAALTLRPSFSTTRGSAVRRAIGTCVGAGLAGLISVAIHGFAGTVVFVGILAFGGVMLLRSNAAIAISLNTAAIVLIIDLASSNTVMTAVDRGLAAVIGAGLAILALLVWRERGAPSAPDVVTAISRSIECEREATAHLYCTTTDDAPDSDESSPARSVGAGGAKPIPRPEIDDTEARGWLALFALDGAIFRKKDEAPKWSAGTSVAVAAGLRHIRLLSATAAVLRTRIRYSTSDRADASEGASDVDLRLARLETTIMEGSRAPHTVPSPLPHLDDEVLAWHARELDRIVTGIEQQLGESSLSP